jgi:hypothetical protein
LIVRFYYYYHQKMPIKKIGLYELRTNDIICSIYSKNENKWIRDLNNIDNHLIHIHQLKVFRFFDENKKWILYLYDENLMNKINIFELNLDINETVAIYI